MSNRSIVLATLATVSLGSSTVAVADGYYVWRGANGQKSYSDTCPSGETCTFRGTLKNTKKYNYSTTTTTTSEPAPTATTETTTESAPTATTETTTQTTTQSAPTTTTTTTESAPTTTTTTTETTTETTTGTTPIATTTPTVTPSSTSTSRFLADEVSVDKDLRNHPDILWYPRFDTEQTVYEDFGYTTRSKEFSKPGGRDPTFGVPAPEFGTTAARYGSSWTGNVLCSSYETDPVTGYRIICATGDGSSVANYRFYLNQNTRLAYGAKALGDKPLNDLYLRQCYMIEADVLLGMTEVGMKLGGFEKAIGTVNDLGITTALWHARKATDGRFRLTTYWYGSGLQYDAWGGDWVREPYTQPFYMKVDKWYCAETFLRVNTRNADGTVNSDGTLIQWFYDMETGEQREVFRGENLKLHNRSTGVIEINHIHLQLFHGGAATPSQQIHWRVTGFALSHKRIGPPKVLH